MHPRRQLPLYLHPEHRIHLSSKTQVRASLDRHSKVLVTHHHLVWLLPEAVLVLQAARRCSQIQRVRRLLRKHRLFLQVPQRSQSRLIVLLLLRKVMQNSLLVYHSSLKVKPCLDILGNRLNLTICIQQTVEFSYLKDIPTSSQIVPGEANEMGGYLDEKDPNTNAYNVYHHIAWGRSTAHFGRKDPCNYSAEVRFPFPHLVYFESELIGISSLQEIRLKDYHVHGLPKNVLGK